MAELGFVDRVKELADHFAAELDAQFRTLNSFVNQAGEIGRSHEVFLRGIISRFLPAKLKCGTGFIVSQRLTSRQQDIIIFDHHNLPVMLAIGDCVVVHAEAVAAAIEVKTNLDTADDFRKELQKLSQLQQSVSCCAIGLYAWNGISLEKALDCYWRFFTDEWPNAVETQPHFVYVRGRYIIMPNFDGRFETPPIMVFRLGEDGHSEGAGLLSLIERLWISGVQHHAPYPGWVDQWRHQISSQYALVDWPESFAKRVKDELARRCST